jgi:hypothetical protein
MTDYAPPHQDDGRPRRKPRAAGAAKPDLFLERDAVISDCGKYRYLLRRTWDYKRPRALIVMLNPSVANAEIDDPTIRSCHRLLRGAGDLAFGSFEVVNLFALRATDPSELCKVIDPVGPHNAAVMAAAIERCDIAICAWGAHSMAMGSRQIEVMGELRCRRPAVYCFGKTKHGAPLHPLYLRTGTPLEVYGA